VKRTVISIFVIILIVGCGKDNFELEKEGKIKMKYFYSNSSDTDPYSFTTYSYDSDWNLVKELISDAPKPIWAFYIYLYNDNGELINKKHYAKLGENYPDQTESSFTLLEEFKYVHFSNKTIEMEYYESELTDSIISEYFSNLLISESHYDIIDQTETIITYEYDTNGNFIKETSLPDGDYSVYFYENSKVQKTLSYNSNDSLLSETIFIYTEIGDNEITETFVGDFLYDKTTKENGNIIEYIRYHPTFFGEWYCHRYEYF